jgi:tripartite-type tricarboxylate transporter receptor subunit TctC
VADGGGDPPRLRLRRLRPRAASDAEFYIWAGLFAPRGTPEPVLAKLRDTVWAAVGDPDFKAAMDKLETPVAFKQGDEFRKFFDADARRLAEGVRKVGRIETK